MENKLLHRFCFIALLEGISYLVLLGIAMPLKYLADMPLMVEYTGWVHGLLFVLYIGFLIFSAVLYNWKFGRVLLIFLAALLPFAPFIVERKLKREMAKKLSAAQMKQPS
jgi:integral membrane protein